MNRNICISLVGSTASGKTNLAMKICNVLPCEIISVDSAMIYKGMNIGTAKPSKEELRKYPHRLIDICDVTEVYSVCKFLEDLKFHVNDIFVKGKIPLLVGGTMMYFNALRKGISKLPAADLHVRKHLKRIAITKGVCALHNYLLKVDKKSAQVIHPNDYIRICRALEIFILTGKPVSDLKRSSNILNINNLYFALVLQREELHASIEKRFNNMLQAGFEEEVRRLRPYVDRDMPSMRCVGYRQMLDYIDGLCSYEDMVYKAICATRQLAKRQMTWIRSWNNITLIDAKNQYNALDTILQSIANNSYKYT